MSGDADLVVVALPPDGVSGSIPAAALESAGIPVEVRGTYAGWLLPGAGGGLGAVQVLVAAEYGDRRPRHPRCAGPRRLTR